MGKKDTVALSGVILGTRILEGDVAKLPFFSFSFVSLASDIFFLQ
jgi:hypothetical protein